MRRLWLLLALIAVPAAAQETASRAHMEGCLLWGRLQDGRYGAANQCRQPITLLFMSLNDQRVIEGEIPAQGQFAISDSPPDGETMFTACPRGYLPSVRFGIENAQPIIVSLYNCRAGRPNS